MCLFWVFYQSFEIAQELLKSAKQRAYREKRTGTIDWMVIENDATGSAVLEYQRHGPDDKPGKTLRDIGCYFFQLFRQILLKDYPKHNGFFLLLDHQEDHLFS